MLRYEINFALILLVFSPSGSAVEPARGRAGGVVEAGEAGTGGPGQYYKRYTGPRLVYCPGGVESLTNTTQRDKVMQN